MTRKNQYYLEYIIFRLFEFFIRLVPSFILPHIAKLMAFIAFKIIKYRRQVAMDNLAVAFPEKKEEERFMIAYRSVEHFILVIFEFMKLSKWSLKKLQKKVHIDKPEMFDTILEGNQDKGVIFVSGHFGNWEIPIAFLAEGHPRHISIIQQRQNNYLIDQHLTNIRARRGMKIYYTGDAIKNGLEDLKKQGLVAIVCDQDAGMRGVFIPFFGRMASTPIGAALLHLHSKSRLVFGASVRTGRLRFKGITIPIQYNGSYETTRENITKITLAFTKTLEQVVRKYPEQYLWTHRRWKTKYNPEVKIKHNLTSI